MPYVGFHAAYGAPIADNLNNVLASRRWLGWVEAGLHGSDHTLWGRPPEAIKG